MWIDRSNHDADWISFEVKSNGFWWFSSYLPMSLLVQHLSFFPQNPEGENQCVCLFFFSQLCFGSAAAFNWFWWKEQFQRNRWSQFAEQRGQISGDLCIEGWRHQNCSSPCRSDFPLFCDGLEQAATSLICDPSCIFFVLLFFSLRNVEEKTQSILQIGQLVHTTQSAYPVAWNMRRNMEERRKICVWLEILNRNVNFL